MSFEDGETEEFEEDFDEGWESDPEDGA